MHNGDVDDTARRLVARPDVATWRSTIMATTGATDGRRLCVALLRAITPFFQRHGGQAPLPDWIQSAKAPLEPHQELDAEYPWQLLEWEALSMLQQCLHLLLDTLLLPDAEDKCDAEASDDTARLLFVPVMQWLELRRVDGRRNTVQHLSGVARLCRHFAPLLGRLRPVSLVQAMAESLLQQLWTLHVLPDVETAVHDTAAVVDDLLVALTGCVTFLEGAACPVSAQSNSGTDTTLAERGLVAVVGWLEWTPDSTSSQQPSSRRQSGPLHVVLLRHASTLYKLAGSRSLFHTQKCVDVACDIVRLHGAEFAPSSGKSTTKEQEVRCQAISFLDVLLAADGVQLPAIMSSIMWREHGSAVLALVAELQAEEGARYHDPEIRQWMASATSRLVEMVASASPTDDCPAMSRLRADIRALEIVGGKLLMNDTTLTSEAGR